MSGVKASEVIESLCPRRSRRTAPEAGSQSFTVRSTAAEANSDAVGEKTTWFTAPV